MTKFWQIGLLGLATIAAGAGCHDDTGSYGTPGGYYSQQPPPMQQPGYVPPGPPVPGYAQPGYPQPGYPSGQVISPNEHPAAGRWVLLGQTDVKFNGDHDVIMTNPSATWKRLQLTAASGAIEIYAVRVNFLNRAAPPYVVPIPKGYVLTRQNPSVIIELPGDVRRNITQIDFSYRSVNNVKDAKLNVAGQ